MVTAICFLAVYMLADVEDIVDKEARNPAESTELKANPNQLRGMPDNRYNNNNNNNINNELAAGNNNNMNNPNMIPNISSNQSPPATEMNGFGSDNNNPSFDGNNNFNGGGGGGMMENSFGPESPVNNVPIDEENMDNPMDREKNEMSSPDLHETEGSLIDNNNNKFGANNNNEEHLEDKLSFRENNELPNIDEHRAKEDDDAATVEEEEQWNSNENQAMENPFPNGGPQDGNFSPTNAETEMIETATNNVANEELNSAIRDFKMDIEEAEEEQLIKEFETIFHDPVTNAEDNMKDVIEYILKDKKYSMSKDALREMEMEVEERLENEVEDELSEKAEKIAEEKEEEIDVVVIEDRNMYPNVADIEKDMKRMGKYFIKDMENEMDETAAVIMDTIPQKIENITMDVLEKKTGLHIKEDYLKSTEKKIAKKKQEIGEEKQQLKEDGKPPVKKASSGKKQTEKTPSDKKKKDKKTSTTSAKKESPKNTSGTKKKKISSETIPESNAEDGMIGDHERSVGTVVETTSKATREEMVDEHVDANQGGSTP